MNQLLSILNIEFLIKEDSFKNWRMIFFLSALAMIMIASGHSADQKIFLIAELNTDLKALKSEFIEQREILLDLKNESTVMKNLSLKGIGPSKVPATKIVVTK